MSVTHKSIIALALTSALIGGCSTTNPYTQEQQSSKATKGAVAGAAAGILAGMIAGDSADNRRDKALIGAVVGGATGGGIGYSMDVQEAKLRQQLQGTGVSVTRYGENIILNMPGNVTFDSYRADINAGFYPVLDSVALVLKEFNKTLIHVTGHTDNTGSDQLNQILSEQRANSVAQYLMSRQISAQRFVIRGASKHQPIADNSTESGRSTNRRVEITLVPMPQ
jgi:outer membrane protein OmpA-like peptidoglycan-associated protein